jgi:energy-coupling factor transport system ATP-binding protein
VIELRNLTVGYGDRPVLAGVDLTVADGELVLVAGRTGVGKSTLLGTFNGLVPAFTGGRLTGDVLVDGRSVLHLPPRDRVETVGYVGQDPAAGFVTDVVEEELAYGMEQLGLPPATMRRRVEETLDLLGIAGLRRRNLRTLSGGEQQRVAIGSVLTMHPRVLVLDEPTSALDRSVQKEIVELLRNLQKAHGLAYVFISHDLAVVRALSDEIMVMKSGKVVERGTAGEIFDRPREEYTRDLIAAAFLTGGGTAEAAVQPLAS